MKRVKESYYRQHPDWQNTAGISGIKELEGEDLCNELKYTKEEKNKENNKKKKINPKKND